MRMHIEGNMRHRFISRLILVLLIGAGTCLLGGLSGTAFVGNIDPNHKFAWGENVGCINVAPTQGPGVTLTSNEVTGFAWSANVGWINLHPNNGGGVDYHGQGVLSGYAWAENAGWLSFSCENTNSCGTATYAVTIDPVTRVFSGFVWGENLGWVRFPPSNEVGVPDVVKQPLSGATSMLTSGGLTVGSVTEQASALTPAGFVISQSPSACTSAVPGSAVNLVVSNGPPPTFTLVVVRDNLPAERAVVLSEVSGLNCGPDCSEVIPAGTPLNFSLTPTCLISDPNPCPSITRTIDQVLCQEGMAGCTVTVRVIGLPPGTPGCPPGIRCSPKQVAASLPYQTASLKIRINGNGMVTSPEGINCGQGQSACQVDGIHTNLVTILAAQESPGNAFDRWDDCDSPLGRSCAMSMNANKILTVTFTAQASALFVTTIGTGSVICKVADAVTSCAGPFPLNTVVTLSGDPASGFAFAGWHGSGCRGTGTCQITMTSNKNVKATFRALPVKKPRPSRTAPSR